MKTLVKEAGDTHLLHLMRWGRLPGRWFDLKISEGIAASDRFFELIYAKICAASQVYEERRYDTFLEQRMQEKRKEVHAALIKEGFMGEYRESNPHFRFHRPALNGV